MKILNECSFLKNDSIEIIEKKYDAKYVLESCIKNINGSWCNFPAAIFYTQESHPDGSNYFAMYIHPERGGLMITNGISATEPVYAGLKVGDNIIYSRYRHDFRSEGDAFVDGGREYFRFSGPQEDIVRFKIFKDKLEILDVD
jgi:hypothetical protein